MTILECCEKFQVSLAKRRECKKDHVFLV